MIKWKVDWADIRRQYDEGKDAHQLSKELGIHFGTIYWHIKKFGPLRPRGGMLPFIGKTRKYDFNFEYFGQHLDEHRAYWLGFLAADSCVKKNRTELELKLKTSDKYHIREFLDDIGAFTTPIFDRPARLPAGPCSYARVNHPQFVADLARYNIVPAKSLILVPPTNIPRPLMRDFYRGLLDGDGHVSAPNDSSAINLVGTKAVCQGFIDFIVSYKNIDMSRIRPKQNGKERCWRVHITDTARCAAILAILYGKATVYLDRKRKRAEVIIKRFEIKSGRQRRPIARRLISGVRSRSR